MSNNRIKYIVIGCIVMLACKNVKNHIKFADFPIQNDMGEYLVHNPVLENCYKPIEILSIDTLLIIHDLKDINSVFKIFSAKNYKLLSTFGKLGNGPNEYLGPAYPKIDYFHKMIWFIDIPKTTLFGFAIKDVIKAGNNATPVKTIKINKKLMPIFDFQILQDTSVIIPTSANVESLFTKISLKGMDYKTYGMAEKDFQGLEHFQKNDYFSKTIAYNDSTNEIVFFNKFCDKQIKYKFVSDETVTALGKNFELVPPTILNNRSLFIDYFSFSRVKSYGKYLYSIYYGRNGKDPKQNKWIYSKIILVFDWNLVPQKALIFPNSLIDFTILNDRILVLTDDMENQLQVYSLNQ